MEKYHRRLHELFALLALANMADTEHAEQWQRVEDIHQDDTRFFGCIWNAIKCIAGPAILEHWAECNEVDLSLADRN